MPAITFQALAESIPFEQICRLTMELLYECPSRLKSSAEPNFEVLEGSVGADVILINAPAAVGKTTLAEQLSAVRGAPLLDLASVRVGRASLRGLLPELGGAAAEEALLAGQTAVIIDSVDEGQLLSGPGNLEEFLESTWDLLDGRPGEGTRIIVLGRPDTIDLVRLTLGLDARQLSVMDLRVEYFDSSEARKLVHMYADHATEEGQRVPHASWSRRRSADGVLCCGRAGTRARPQRFVGEP